MKFYKGVAIALAAISMIACSENKKASDTETLNVAGITSNKNLTVTDKAEKLALISEQLFSLTNFMHAVDIADLALQQDPNNLRAQFYKHAAGPLMALKGFATRIKPMLKPDDLVKWNAQIDNFPDSALKTFLLDGEEDIKDEKGIQAFIDSYIVATNDMRTFLKTYQGQDITLNANDWSWSSFISHKLTECSAMQNYSGEYTEFKCPMKKAGQIKLNKADMAALQQAYGAYQILYTMYNVYDLSGVMALNKAAEGKELSAKESWDFLSKYKDFGVYRASSQLQLVKEMGLDFVGAYRWAQKLQKQLCPHGYEVEKNRPGYLFHSGICLKNDKDTSESLELAEVILNGGLMPMTVGSFHGDFNYQTEAKPVLLFTNPIQDLKSLKPAFRSCQDQWGDKYESLVEVADPTLNGVLPNADLNTILRLQDPCQEY